MRVSVLLVLLAVVLAAPSSALAADAAELRIAFDSIYEPTLDISTVREVRDLRIEHQDMVLALDSGVLAFYRPVTIDSSERFFGLYFEGEGRFQFQPPVDVERDQLRRFFNTDSLNRPIDQAFLTFSEPVYQHILENTAPSTTAFGKKQMKRVRDEYRRLIKDEIRYYAFNTLRALIDPTDRPYLHINVTPRKTSELNYMYNPFRREEVTLSKRYWRPGIRFMEVVCRYSELIDSTYRRMAGTSKGQLAMRHYDVDARIDRAGLFDGRIRTHFRTKRPMQLVTFGLHDELTVDSIVDAQGASIEFLRWEKEDNQSSSLYLILNQPIPSGDSTWFDFYYQGEICERDLGEFFVTAGAEWYPHYSTGYRTTFDMTFRTPRRFPFVATGRRIDSTCVDDTVITTWRVDEPAHNVAFTIGNLTAFDYDDERTCQVSLLYHKDLHQHRNRQRQVSEDILGSLALFSHLYGPYPYDRLTVSEVLTSHGEAFPGFIHLGYFMWETDNWGYSRLDRAHEVAHQWWGVGVGTETYHDRWLSEGFAEYSGLLYLQAALGNDKFIQRLREYRKEILSVRQYAFGSGDESGPIILGYRTGSTETQGDFGLIIYKKGAWVLHMLRNLLVDLNTMDDGRFFELMREFHSRYRGRPATTADFQAIAEEYAGIPLDWFFRQWVYENQLPLYRFDYDCQPDEQGRYDCECTVTTEDADPDFKMFLPVEIVFADKTRAYTRVLIDQPDMIFPIDDLPQKPRKLVLNPFESVLARVKQ